MKPLKNEAVEQVLTGRVIGYHDGHLYCDNCSKGLNTFEVLCDNREPLELTAFCVSLQEHHGRWHINRVYCSECDEREINTPTQGVDEAMVELKIDKGQYAPKTSEIEVVDRSKPDDAVTG